MSNHYNSSGIVLNGVPTDVAAGTTASTTSSSHTGSNTTTNTDNNNNSDQQFSVTYVEHHIRVLIFSLAFALCICLFFKLCRFLGSEDEEEQVERDHRLAQQLQQQEVRAQRRRRMTEEERAEWDEKAKLRSEFVDQALQPRVEDSTGSSVPLKEEGGGCTGNVDKDKDEEEANFWRCAICLSEHDTEQKQQRIQATADTCPHEFHRACIADWLLHRIDCPICRQPFLKEDLCHATKCADKDASTSHSQPENNDADDDDDNAVATTGSLPTAPSNNTSCYVPVVSMRPRRTGDVSTRLESAVETPMPTTTESNSDDPHPQDQVESEENSGEDEGVTYRC